MNDLKEGTKSIKILKSKNSSSKLQNEKIRVDGEEKVGSTINETSKQSSGEKKLKTKKSSMESNQQDLNTSSTSSDVSVTTKKKKKTKINKDLNNIVENESNLDVEIENQELENQISQMKDLSIKKKKKSKMPSSKEDSDESNEIQTSKKKKKSTKVTTNPNAKEELILKERRQNSLIELQKEDPNRQTFNELDEKFQLNPEDDDEKIFEEEIQMITELRNHFGKELDCLNDKFLAWFLCARRHNLEQVIELLHSFLSKRKESEYEDIAPSVDSFEELTWLISQRTWFFLPNLRDQYGRAVEFFVMRNNDAKKRQGGDIKRLVRFLFWKADLYVASLPLRVLREGIVWTIDLESFSVWKK
jgi:hypothetical protein